MKQNYNNSCLACVLAIIVDESEQYVLDWFKYIDPPFSDEDAFLFLAHHGIYLAFSAKLLNGSRITGRETLEIELDMQGRAAYVVVESERYAGRTHAIFWDGYRVYDPNPDTEDGRLLESYNVERFYPMMLTEERQRIFRR
ncbi:MAG: hypothetical protein ACXAB9_15160 [Candidatus Thorarchaeota archaeon]|jgi:hypothetical protein